MEQEPENDSYSPAGLVVVCASSWVSSASLILLFFGMIRSVSFDNTYLLPNQNDLLIEGLWSAFAYFLVGIALAKFNSFVKKFVPSWVVIPIVGTFIFLVSFWSVAYWNTVSNYNPNSPFSESPPDLYGLIAGVVYTLVLMSVLATLVSYVAYGAFSHNDGGTGIHIEH